MGNNMDIGNNNMNMNIQNNNQNNNQKMDWKEAGFTLIELLAVITIMGILMMVAIPAVTRTITNSKKDTFVNISKEYIASVRKAVIADDIECGSGANAIPASSGVASTTYYIEIKGGDSGNAAILLENGGGSPFNANKTIVGFISWTKSSATKPFVYSASLSDGTWGFDTSTEATLKGSKVVAKTAGVKPSSGTVCNLK